MLISVAGFLSTFGFIAWVLGIWADLPEVATIGAVVIVGVGASVTTEGLQVKDGEHRDRSWTNDSGAGNEPVNNETAVQFQYSDVGMPDQFPAGVVIMLLGAAGVFRSLNRAGDSL